MRVFVVMCFLCLLGRNVGAQVGEQVEKLSLVELIVESDVVYRLSSMKNDREIEWVTLAGVKRFRQIGLWGVGSAFGKERLETIKWSMENVKEGTLPSDFVLGFSGLFEHGSAYFYLHHYSADVYLQKVQGPMPGNTMLFPEYDGLRDDLIWLCRNRYLLRLLKKGELTTKIYHFTAHELEFLVRVCPEEYLRGLHAYAKSDEGGDQLATLYQFMDYAPAEPKRFPLLDEGVVERLAVAIDDEIVDGVMFTDPKGSLKLVRDKIVNKGYLTERDKRLLLSFFINGHDARELQGEVAAVMKNEILAKGDVGLLKTYLQRMEKRQSVADLTHLAEIINSKRFTEGEEEFQNLVVEQFKLRKEKEVVWILAPLIEHKDLLLAWQVRLIMQKFTPKDLGNDPVVWRAWYKKENE